MSDSEHTPKPTPEDRPTGKRPLREGESSSDSSKQNLSKGVPTPSVPSTASHQADIEPSDRPSGSTPQNLDDRTIVSDRPPLPRHGPSQGIHPIELGNILEGQQLDHYRLEEFIGGGGMGAVFRSTDTTLDRIVAVKVLSAGTAGSEEMLLRFRNEAQSAARLDHENIARVFYVGEDRGIPYIVFEYIEGVNIRDLVTRRGPFKLIDAIEYTLQIAEALAHASQRDVVHRDIKPSNVLVTSEGRAKLVDMGLARLHQVEHSENDITASGVTLGTFDYISPEQARDPRSADVRSDLYSLGCTLFFMLTGQPPFPEGTVLQKLLQHQGDEAPDVRQLRPDLPLEVTSILERMLEKSPDKRYQTPEELIAELLVLGRQMGVPASGGRHTVVVTSNSASSDLIWRHLPWAAPLCILLATVYGLYLVGQNNASTFEKNTFAQQEISQPRNPGEDSSDSSPSDSEKTRAAKKSSAGDGPGTRESTQDQSGAARSVDPESNRSGNQPIKSGQSPSAKGGASSREPSQADRSTSEPESSPSKLTPSEPENVLSTATDRGATSENPNGFEPEDTARNSSRTASGNGIPAAPEPESRPFTSHGAVHIVNRTGAGEGHTTLRSAIDAARNGDTINLEFNGPLRTEPLQLSDRRLTIRSGKGYQPTILFSPTSDFAAPFRSRRAMLRVLGGEFIVQGVHLVAEVSSENDSATWTMIEAHGAKNIQFDDCVLSLRTALDNSDREVRTTAPSDNGNSFVHVALPSSAESRLFPEADRPVLPSVVRLKNCIVRGEATLLRSDQGQPVRLLWDNGLLATSQRLLVLEVRRARSLSGRAGDLISPEFEFPEMCYLELRHLTAVVESGLALVTESDELDLSGAVTIRCLDSIITTSRDAPMIDYRGFGDTTIPSRFVWESELNFYEHVRDFWSNSNFTDLPPSTLDFVSWKDYWSNRAKGEEIKTKLDRVRWNQLPKSDLPFSEHSPEDYRLSGTATDNPALGGASDGRNVGMDLTELPEISPDSESASDPSEPVSSPDDLTLPPE